jgi:hypothetical protein
VGKNPIRTVCPDNSNSGYYYNAYSREPEQNVERSPDPTGVEKTAFFDDLFASLTMHAQLSSNAFAPGFVVLTVVTAINSLWVLFV